MSVQGYTVHPFSARDTSVRTLVDLLERPARERANDLAVEIRDHGRASERITFAEWWRSARSSAAHLMRNGVRPGDRVGLLLPTSRAFLDAFFGTVLAGGIPVPLAPPFSFGKLEAYRESLRSILHDSGAAACVSLPRYVQEFGEALRTGERGLAFLEPEQAVNPCSPGEVHRPDPSDTAFLQYTSGSTSRPKGVDLTHANLLANVQAICATKGTRYRDTMVSWLPLYHDMGLIGALFASLYNRTPLILLPPQAFMKDPISWLRAISETGATVSCAPNFAYRYCVDRAVEEELVGIRLDSLEILFNGAEPIDADVVASFQERFAPYGLRPDVVRPVYGLAESCLAVTFSDPGPLIRDVIDAEILESKGEAVPATLAGRTRTCVSVGRAIPTQEIRIVDDRGCTVPERRVGEILVRGPSVMKGYYGRRDATAEALRDGWLHTGDVGYIAGGEVYITGRKKDLIIRRGRNYHPEDIEWAVRHMGAGRKGCVVAFGVESDADTSVVVIAETRARREEDLRELREDISTQVSRAFLFKPDRVCLVRPGAIPRTTSGKVRRQICKRLYLEGRIGEGA